MAQCLALLAAVAALSGQLSARHWVLVVVVAVPTVFYIHPSSFFVFFPALLLSQGVSLLALGVGAMGCLLPLLTGEVNPAQVGVAPLGTIGSSLLWDTYDRLKGVFHYLFSDPHGLLKFFSIRSLLAYLGIAALLRERNRRVLLLVVLLPFALALCALMPWGVLRAPGAVFYQQVKRIAEVGFLPLLICMAWGLAWIEARIGLRSRLILIVLLAAWALASSMKARRTVSEMSELFETPKKTEVLLLDKALRTVPPGSVLVAGEQWFALTRALRPDLLYVGSEGECRFSRAPACTGRQAFIEEVLRADASGGELMSPHFAGREIYLGRRSGNSGSAVTVMKVRRGLP
jgi:hypothetical protein